MPFGSQNSPWFEKNWTFLKDNFFPFSQIMSHLGEKLSTVSCESVMLNIWESTKSHLYSKFALFKTFWQTLRVLLHLSPLGLASYLPLLRVFQLGTVWPCTSSEIENTTSQNWKFNFYLVKLDVSIRPFVHIFYIPLGTHCASNSSIP